MSLLLITATFGSVSAQGVSDGGVADVQAGSRELVKLVRGTALVPGTSLTRIPPSLVLTNGIARSRQLPINPITISATGAAAKVGAAVVAFTPDVFTKNAVTVNLPNGNVLQSTIAGLVYQDTSSGKMVFIATLKSSIGQIEAPNRLVYLDAFNGVKADVSYSVQRGRQSALHQDVIVRESLPPPSNWELNTDTCVVQIWTELFESPVPLALERAVELRPGSTNGLVVQDHSLEFGKARMISGRCFGVDKNGVVDAGVPVSKTITEVQGRRFLVESCAYTAIKPRLDALLSTNTVPIKRQAKATFSPERLPVPPVRGPGADKIGMASLTRAEQNGLVLDYVLVSPDECDGESQVCAGVPLGCVAWWPGDNDTNNLRGITSSWLTNGATYASGKVGQAFSFDGTDDEFVVANSSSLNPTTGMTLEAWVYRTAASTALRTIIAKGDPVGNRQYGLVLTSDNKLQAQVGVAEAGTVWGGTSAAILPTNEWHHVAMTFDGLSLNIFFDGYLDASYWAGNDLCGYGDWDCESPMTVVTSSQSFRVGGNSGGHFKGMVDEVTIYDSALSDADIYRIYAAGTNGKCKVDICAPVFDGLAAWWPAEGNANDYFGSSHGAISNGMTYGPNAVGSAFNFDGSDNYVKVTNTPAINATNGLTLEAWIRLNRFEGNHPIFSKDSQNPTDVGRQYLMTVSFGQTVRPHVHTLNDPLFVCYDGSTVIEVGKWYHVAMTYDGADLNLYVNGALDSSYALEGGGAMVGSEEPLFIGGVPYSSYPYYFPGEIDEPTVFNRALSADEICSIYNAGMGGKCKDVDGDGLPDWWEYKYWSNLTPTAMGDADGDGVSNLQEYQSGTNPIDADRDGDGVSDYIEVLQGRNPLVSGIITDTNNLTQLKVFTPFK